MKSYSSRFLKWLDGLVNSLAYKKRFVGEYVNLYKKRKLIQSVVLTSEQRREIDQLWERSYGKKIPYHWHRLYTYYTGTFDVNYFPEIFYSTILERLYNDSHVALCAEDKSQLDLLLRQPGMATSSTIPLIASNVQGKYYDSDHRMINEDEFVSILHNVGKSGRGVRVLEIKNGIDVKTEEEISDILNSYREDYLVQSFLKTHESVKLLNSSSVNTIRIVTYICENHIFHAPLAMRIGTGNAEVDNIHAGGLVIGLSDDGVLNEYAFSEYGQKLYKHPTSDITFKGYRIPNVGMAISLVEQSHLLIPRLTFISWDVTILEDGTPVIIEMNTRNQSAWFPQMVNGQSIFGSNTEKMIKMLKKDGN